MEKRKIMGGGVDDEGREGTKRETTSGNVRGRLLDVP